MRKWFLLLLLPAVVAGCTSAPKSPPTGAISGTGSPCIGPATPSLELHKLTVAVTLLDTARHTRVQTVKYPWKFQFEVSPGTYELVENGAPRVTVHVHGGRTANVTLTAICI